MKPIAQAPMQPDPREQPDNPQLLRARWGRFIRTAALWTLLLLVADRVVDVVLLQGLQRYFGLNGEARVLCIGHSRSQLGIDETQLAADLGVPVAKYTMDGVGIREREAMIRFALRRLPHVRVVVYDVGDTTLSGLDLGANVYRLMLPFMQDPVAAGIVRKEGPGPLTLLAYRLLHTLRYDEATLNRSVRGWLGVRENFKMDRLNEELMRDQISGNRFRRVRVDPDALRVLTRTVESVTDRGNAVLLWHPPTIDLLDDVDHERRRNVRNIYRNMQTENPLLHYVEYVSEFRGRHDVFYDAIHVNSKGRKEITARLAEDIRALGCLEPADSPSHTPAVRNAGRVKGLDDSS